MDYDPSGSIAQIIVHGAGDTYTAGTGKVLDMNFWSNRTNSILYTSTDELLNAPGLCFNTFTNTSDKITLIANNFTTGGSTSVWAFLQWIEII